MAQIITEAKLEGAIRDFLAILTPDAKKMFIMNARQTPLYYGRVYSILKDGQGACCLIGLALSPDERKFCLGKNIIPKTKFKTNDRNNPARQLKISETWDLFWMYNGYGPEDMRAIILRVIQ